MDKIWWEGGEGGGGGGLRKVDENLKQITEKER